MNIVLFILLCLYLAWTGMILFCVSLHMISKYVYKEQLTPLKWNWLPKLLWHICTVIVVFCYFRFYF